MKVDPVLTLQLIKIFYKGVLRPIVFKAVIDTKTEWDDGLLEVADRIFEYNKDKINGPMG